MKRYRIKIVTFMDSHKEYTPQFKGVFWNSMTSAGYKMASYNMPFTAETMEKAMKAIELAIERNKKETAVTVEFKYL